MLSNINIFLNHLKCWNRNSFWSGKKKHPGAGHVKSEVKREWMKPEDCPQFYTLEILGHQFFLRLLYEFHRVVLRVYHGLSCLSSSIKGGVSTLSEWFFLSDFQPYMAGPEFPKPSTKSRSCWIASFMGNNMGNDNLLQWNVWNWDMFKYV